MKFNDLNSSSPNRRWGVLSALTLALALSACSSDRMPTQSDPTADATATGFAANPQGTEGGPGFFPLQIGNTWTYRIDARSWHTGDSVMSIAQYTQRRDLVGTEESFDRQYVVEEWKTWSPLGYPPGDDTVINRIYYRQDRAGLYEADVPGGKPPLATDGPFATLLAGRSMKLAPAQSAAYSAALARLQEKRQLLAAALSGAGHQPPAPLGHPPGGVLRHEITRLQYPLRPGQSWTIREDPLFTSRVLKHDMLNLPAGKLGGYQIQIESEAFGPKDQVFVWYGRTGLLQMTAHLEAMYIGYDDPYGDSTAVIYEEHSSLQGFDFVNR